MPPRRSLRRRPVGKGALSFSRLFILSVLHDLREPFAVDIRLDLHPDGEMIGQLEAEFLAGVVFVRKEFLDLRIADEEIDGAAQITESLLERRQVQDLIVAGV